MGIIQVSDIAKYDGQEVTVQGWVYNRTDKGKLVKEVHNKLRISSE